MKQSGKTDRCITRRAALAGTAATILGGAIAIPEGAAQGATLSEIKRRGYMICATEDDYPPFEFIKDGKPAGLDNALYGVLEKWVPFKLEHRIIPFQGLLAGVVTGKFDLALTAANVTAERAKSLDFLMPVAEGTLYYVKRKGETHLNSIKDLSGKTVGVQEGSAQAAALPGIDEMIKKAGGKGLGRAVYYATYPEAYQDLANGRTDYVVNTIVTIANLVRTRPNVFAMGGAVGPQGYQAWSVKKGNHDLFNLVDGFLAEQRKNGTMVELQEKWLGVSFPNLPDKALLPGNLPIPS